MRKQRGQAEKNAAITENALLPDCHKIARGYLYEENEGFNINKNDNYADAVSVKSYFFSFHLSSLMKSLPESAP